MRIDKKDGIQNIKKSSEVQTFHKTRTNFEQKTKKQTEEILEICKKVHTFAELKENFSEEYLAYYDLFDLNFDLKSIQNKTEIVITLYFSEDVTKEKLLSKFDNLYTKIKIGSVNLKNN